MRVTPFLMMMAGIFVAANATGPDPGECEPYVQVARGELIDTQCAILSAVFHCLRFKN